MFMYNLNTVFICNYVYEILQKLMEIEMFEYYSYVNLNMFVLLISINYVFWFYVLCWVCFDIMRCFVSYLCIIKTYCFNLYFLILGIIWKFLFYFQI